MIIVARMCAELVVILTIIGPPVIIKKHDYLVIKQERM